MYLTYMQGCSEPIKTNGPNMLFSYGIMALNTIDLPFFQPRQQHKMSTTVPTYNRRDGEEKVKEKQGKLK